MTREQLEAVPHPAAKGTLAWEQQHDLLEFDMDSECRATPECICVQCPPTVVPTEENS